jgi:hypothetical protein
MLASNARIRRRMESFPMIRLFLRSKIFLIYNTIVLIPQDHYILILFWIFSQGILLLFQLFIGIILFPLSSQLFQYQYAY